MAGAFDWGTATELQTAPTPTQPGGGPATVNPGNELETAIPFDWGSARPMEAADEQIARGNVEGEQPTVFIQAPPKKDNFLDALNNIAKDYQFRGAQAIGGEIGQRVGETLEIGREEALRRENARAQAVYALSQATGAPLHEVDVHFDDLVKDPKLTGIQGDFTTPLDVLEYGMTLAMPFAFLNAPVATLKGILIFAALDKMIPTENFIPHDAPRNLKEAIRLVDFIAKGAITAGAYKKASPLLDQAVERFTLNKLQEFKLPTEVKLTAEQVKDIWQTGNLTSAEQKEMFNALELTTAQIKLAFERGVTLKIPASRITRITGKPWFEKVRSLFGQEPISKVKTERAGDIVQGTGGLLPAPQYQKMVEQGGGIYVGYQAPTVTKSGRVLGNAIYFNSPKTGSTLFLKLDEMSPEMVRIKIAESDAKFAESVKQETAKLDEKEAQAQREAASQVESERFAPKGEQKGASGERFEGEKRSKGGMQQAPVTPEDMQAAIKNKLGGMEYIKSIQMPELLKIAKELSGADVTVKKSLGKALGVFYHLDFATGWIELSKAIFSDPALAQGVLAHEIGHLVDWLEDKTLLRGNILGRLASVLDYHKTVLPEKPGAPGDLTAEDRARIRKEAERIAKERAGGKKDEITNQFDPEMVLAIWNKVDLAGIPPELVEYVKRLDTDGKKSIIRAALEARKKGKPVTIEDVRKLKQDFDQDPEAVAKIYADLIREEIKKRNLFDAETIMQELKALTQWWHPFDPAKVPARYLQYRYDSRELYAEFISVLLNAPAQAAARAPKTYEAFWNYIANKPGVLKTLLDTQAMIQGSNGELYKMREKDIKGMFETGEQMFRARQLRYEKALKSTWFHARNLLWDKNTSILEKLPEIREKEGFLDPNADPKYILEKNDFVAGITKSYLEKLDPVFQEIVNDGLMPDVDLFMFAKRVAGDRAEFANPLGHNPETAQAQLDFMKQQDPAKFDRIERLVAQIQDWFKGEINPLMKDIYTPQQMKMVESSDNYAPFRVIDFMKDYVSAGIIAQTGTIREIASPFTALVLKATSMISAATRNEIKKSVSNFMLQYPEQFEMRPAKITDFFDGERRVFNIEAPPDKTMGTISWRENGTWRAYHTERYIADIFNHSGNNDIMATGQFLDRVLLNNALFRPMWITFNVTFQARNLVRDFFRTWKSNPEMTLGGVLNAYRKAFPHAIAKVKGEYDAMVNEMYKNAAIGVTLNDLILGEAGEETELVKNLERFGLMPGKQSKLREIPILREIVKGLDAIRFGGDVIESLPKIAGWELLKDLPMEERAYFVRNLIGTPNFKRGGKIKPIANSAFLFANIIKEGYRGMLELATDPELRGQYWKKTAMVSLLSVFLTWLAQKGFFGEDKKREVEGMTEYDKANYINIPFGLNEQGETRYFRLVLDEDGRFFHALAWKLINGMDDPIKAGEDIFSFGAGQLPSPSPLFDLLSKWGQFLGGKNPRDDFRQRDILTEDQRKAGGWDAFEPMLIYTANQTGFSGFQVYDRLKDQTTWKKALGLTPILQSFWRETNYGQQENFREILNEAQKQEAQDRLRLNEQIEADPEKAVAGIEDGRKRTAVQRKISREEVKRGTDPLAKVLIQATSNNQKLAVFKSAFDQFSNAQQLQKYLEALIESKVITEKFSDAVLESFDEEKRKAA